eukprot:scaffold54221_cov55-Phaeocystis_antarctica.AAC.8
MARATRAGPYLLLLDESARRDGWDHASPRATGRDRCEEGDNALRVFRRHCKSPRLTVPGCSFPRDISCIMKLLSPSSVQ